MINRLALTALAAAALGLSAPVAAQAGGPPPELVDQLAAFARSNVTKARESSGSPVPPETPEELAQPIVPRALDVQTVERALLSAAMDTCGLDFAKLSFLPYMGKIRASDRYSERQIAYIALLHGVAMGYFQRSLDPAMCNPGFTADLQREAAESPVEAP